MNSNRKFDVLLSMSCLDFLFSLCPLSLAMMLNFCPRRDFTQKAKSRDGTLVTRAYIKESTYSSNIQSVCQYAPVGGKGNVRAARIFFRYQIPCMNFFRPYHGYFLGLIGVHEFFFI